MKKYFKKEYAKTAGIGVFLFFLLKGIGWLVLFYFGFNLFSTCN